MREGRLSRGAAQDIRYVLACLPTQSKAQMRETIDHLERDGFTGAGIDWLKQALVFDPLVEYRELSEALMR